LKTDLQRFRVIFTIEARDEKEAIHLVSQPDIMREEAVMTIQNVSQRITLRMALLMSPLVAALVLIGYRWAEAFWGSW
jgi:hypothetical protein